jgi:plastocyanin
MKHISALLALSLGATVNAQMIHEIHVIDDEFVPAALTIQLGDQIHLIFDDNNHTFTQVDQATWTANGDTPLPGGYDFGTGTANPGDDHTFTPTGLGTIYYVCVFHVDMGMKGTLSVTGTSGLADIQEAASLRFAPNPARDRITLLDDPGVPVEVSFYDATGRLTLVMVPFGSTVIDVSSVPAGNYQMLVRDRDQKLLARERMVITR